MKLPENCVPSKQQLGCDNAENGTPASVADRVRKGVIGEVGAGRSATEGGQDSGVRGACPAADTRPECMPK